MNERMIHGPRTVPEHDLFTKDGHSLCGRGATYWEWQQDGSFVSSEGERVPRTDLLANLAAKSRGGSLLLQPRMFNHPVLRQLSTAGLCTVRVITSRLQVELRAFCAPVFVCPWAVRRPTTSPRAGSPARLIWTPACLEVRYRNRSRLQDFPSMRTRRRAHRSLERSCRTGTRLSPSQSAHTKCSRSSRLWGGMSLSPTRVAARRRQLQPGHRSCPIAPRSLSRRHRVWRSLLAPRAPHRPETQDDGGSLMNGRSIRL
jgi:hypothetical protein